MKNLMLGNEAIARGAWEAGVTVVSSYPGTPSTEITEEAAAYNEMYVEWAPNEKVALEVAVGASYGGARALCCMKHVGLNVAADPLYTASYTGVNGGLVVVVADDPGMHSSQNEQDSRFYARGALIPMLEPSDSEEALSFTKLAYELSEKYDTPVLLRITTRIAHARTITNTYDRANVPLKPYIKDAMKYVMMPGMARLRHKVVEARMDKLTIDSSSMEINKIESGSDIGVICSGAAYQYVKEVLPDVSVLKLGMVNPLPKSLIQDFAASVAKLYVIEELEPIIEEQVKSWGIACVGKDLTGKQGELSTRKILEIMGRSVPEFMIAPELPQRPPVMCPSCPHRATYSVIKKLGLRATGDIGCYTLGALKPTDAIDCCLCMGASIGMAHGLEKARGIEFAASTVAVIGDSTFIHSGITGLIGAVYNHGNGTVMILDNSTTGMTGHQPNPSTGKDIRGQQTAQLNLEALCLACGAASVRVVDPYNMAELESILKEETARHGISVIIARRPCALILKERNPVRIINNSCRKCKACLKISCPAIENTGGVISINATICNGCGLCQSICKFSAIERFSD